MLKKVVLILPILLLGIVLAAAENNSGEITGSTNSAVRNSNEFSLNKISGKSNVKENDNISEDFNLPILRTVWSSKGNVKNWSLKERPGFLRLKSQPLDIENITLNSFTKEINFNSISDVTCQIDLTNLEEGNETGLYFSNKQLNFIQIKISNGIKKLELVINNKVFEGPVIEASGVIFRTRIGKTKARFEYSVDGVNFIKLGNAFKLNTIQSPTNQVGIYCFTNSEKGSADIDWIHFNQKESSKVKFAAL